MLYNANVQPFVGLMEMGVFVTTMQVNRKLFKHLMLLPDVLTRFTLKDRDRPD